MVWQKAVSVVVLCASATVAGPRQAGVAYSIVRNKSAGSEVGDLVVFYLDEPAKGEVIGNTGLTQVGAIDFWRGELWAVSARDDKLTFCTIDLRNAEARLRSTAERKISGVFAGDFDAQGRFWIVNLKTRTLNSYDPNSGTELSSVELPSDAGYNGIAFVGNTLYAVRGGTGDPPQEFGTLDLTTGEFTLIGYTNVGLEGKGGGNGCGALDYDPFTRTIYLMYRQGVERVNSKPQYWSLYTIDVRTGQSSFVGELQPRATYDALAVMQ